MTSKVKNRARTGFPPRFARISDRQEARSREKTTNSREPHVFVVDLYNRDLMDTSVKSVDF
ncbi:MAG: hypothetical protein AB7P18_12470 [Candidatus Binatia bacterium]